MITGCDRRSAAIARRVAERVTAEVTVLSSEPIAVEVREVTSIPLSAAGKHRFMRSDVVLPVAS